jgi:hypothetical protein
MEEKKKPVSRWWRTTAVLALGVVIGTVLVATPAGSHIGTVTHLWKQHIRPKADKRYLRYEAKVPPRRTLTGIWEASVVASGNGDSAEDAISFAIPLAAAPTVIVVPKGGAVPAGCSGTLAQPDASAGNLCIFVGWNTNTTTPDTIAGNYKAESPTGAQGATRNGTVVYVHANAAGLVETGGSYAVTGPLSGSARVVPSSSTSRSGGGL